MSTYPRTRQNQAIMLKFKFKFQLAVLILIPELSISQNIHIKVFNKTGYNLDSVSFDHFYLGKLCKDSSVFISGIAEMTMQGDVPLHRPFGIIEDKKRLHNLTKCGTKSMKVKEGSYAFDVFIKDRGYDYLLYWKRHE